MTDKAKHEQVTGDVIAGARKLKALLDEMDAVIGAFPDEKFCDAVIAEVVAAFDRRDSKSEFRFMVAPEPFPVLVDAADADAAKRKLVEHFSDYVLNAFMAAHTDMKFVVAMTAPDEVFYCVEADSTPHPHSL